MCLKFYITYFNIFQIGEERYLIPIYTLHLLLLSIRGLFYCKICKYGTEVIRSQCLFALYKR